MFLCCAQVTPVSRVPDVRSGYQPPGAAQQPAASAEALRQGASQVFEQRCVVCHGCYDAPCQLKLESFSGAERGASHSRVYDGSRLLKATPTRLDIDAHGASEWRAQGFHSVLPDRQTPEPSRSVMMRMLDQKRAHPLTDAVDLSKEFTFALDREQTCADAAHFDEFAKQHPLWGMPYALPALEPEAHAAVSRWLAAGAPAGKPSEPSAELQRAITSWEAFFNGTSRKERLSARYIYEHLFLAGLYFKGLDDRSFFRLVRSRTPSGFPVAEIPTRRPFETPGDAPFYYRFVQRSGPTLAKTHMPYALDDARMQRYRELFVTPEYTVTELPSYALEVSSNPFRSFSALPLDSRYKFLLDEAEFTMMGFIKGPVCRGQVALNVIQERFWVVFLAPDQRIMNEESVLLDDNTHELELPASSGSDAVPFRWFEFSRQHARYVKRKAELLDELTQSGRGVSLDLIWTGEGTNQNAALTVFRHFDSATVVKGLVGEPPKTAWVMDYSQFERIHYLLVAGFDVFGNVGHQIMTRLYMDFLRMEGESNLLALLPRARRRQLADAWYQRVSPELKEKVYDELARFKGESKLRYRTQTPERELFAALKSRLDKVDSNRYQLGADAISGELKSLDGFRGSSASFMPEIAFVQVDFDAGPARYFTITRESAHTNVAQLFNEDDRRVPAQDSLSLVPGFLGAYPNQLFRVPRAQLGEFVEQIKRLDAPAYEALRARFGVSRKAASFWSVSDAAHNAYRELQPLEAGVFDYNRLQP